MPVLCLFGSVYRCPSTLTSHFVVIAIQVKCRGCFVCFGTDYCVILARSTPPLHPLMGSPRLSLSPSLPTSLPPFLPFPLPLPSPFTSFSHACFSPLGDFHPGLARSQNLVWRCATIYFRITLWATGISYTIVGLENLDPDENYFFACNHEVDPFSLSLYLSPLCTGIVHPPQPLKYYPPPATPPLQYLHLWRIGSSQEFSENWAFYNMSLPVDHTRVFSPSGETHDHFLECGKKLTVVLRG